MNKAGPDFLGIGVQRGATTWLHEQLNQHPNIWLPPKKELHYFSRSPRYSTPSFLAREPLLRRLLGTEIADRHFRRHLARDLVASMKAGRFNDFMWYWRYYFGARDFDWYADLFPNDPDRAKGEICPAYAVLDPIAIQAIQRRWPELKIIYLLRNPVDRLWSSLRYSGRLKQAPGKVLDLVEEFARSESQVARSDYLATIERWSGAFGAQRLHLAFFEQVQTDPEQLLADVHRFLGLPSSTLESFQRAQKVSNAAEAQSMPAAVRSFLCAHYLDQLRILSDRYGGYCSQWLDDAQANLS